MRRSRIVALLAATESVALAQAPGDPQPPVAPIAISIEDAMRAVDRASHGVAAARAIADRASADVTAARSGYFPQVTSSGSYTRTLRSEFDDVFRPDAADGAAASPLGVGELPFGRDHAWRAGVGLTQPIWDGGRTAGAVGIATHGEQIAELDVNARRAQAVLEVTEAYFDAVYATRVVAIAEASLALAEDTLGQTRLGFTQGTAPEFDVLRAEVTRAEQRTALIRTRALYARAALRLHQLIGLPLDRPLALTTPLAVGDVDALARTARRTAGVSAVGLDTVSVARARAGVGLRRSELALARAGRWPSFAAITDLGVVDYPTRFWPDSDWRTNWTIGVNVTFPVFTGLRTTAEIEAARAEIRAAERQLAEVRELTELAARTATLDLEVANATLDATARSAALARRAHAIAQVRYREGVSTFLELVDARLALDRAQAAEASATRDVAVAAVRIALLPALPVAGAGTAGPTEPLREATVATRSLSATAAPGTIGTAGTIPPVAFGLPGERGPGGSR